MDIPAPAGTKLVCIMDGEVVSTGWGGAGGYTITIASIDREYRFSYCHASPEFIVSVGQQVKNVTVGKVKPTNGLTAGTASNVKKADYERDAYIIYCSDDDDLSSITGYVDIYTGKVIGGFYGGV